MDRRRYRHKKKIVVALQLEQEEASKELGQIGGNIFVKSTLVLERMPTSKTPPIGIHSITPWRSLYESCRLVKHCDSSERTVEIARESTAARSQT